MLPSIGQSEPGFSSAIDAYKFVKRLDYKNLLSKDEQKAIREALDGLIKDFKSRGLKSYEMTVLDDMVSNMGSVQSLVRLDEHLRAMAHGLPDPYRGEAIDRIARAINMPGYRTNGYHDTYYGKLIQGEPGATSIKIYEPWQTSNPSKNVFEIGRPLESYAAGESGTKGSATGYGVRAFARKDQFPEEGRQLVGSIINNDRLSASELEKMGAEFTRNPDAQILSDELDRLFFESWEKENLLRDAKRLERMPLSGRALRKGRESSGLQYNEMAGRTQKYQPGASRKLHRRFDKIFDRNLSELKKGDGRFWVVDDIVDVVDLKDGSARIKVLDPLTGQTDMFTVDKNGVIQVDFPFDRGGFLNRMSSVYKNDRDSMILAIQNARKKMMKK